MLSKVVALSRAVYQRMVTDDYAPRMRLLRGLGKLVFPEYRFKTPFLDWWNDEWFNQYLKRFDEMSRYNFDRRWNLFQLCKLAHAVEGDTAECGVYKGSSSYLIANCNRQSAIAGKVHHGFDSFQGLSNPGTKDGSHWSAGALETPLEEAQKNLEGFDVKLYSGWFPEKFTEVVEKTFSFVHIDVDLYEPAMDSLEFFYSRMTEGGIILMDDFGLGTCPGVTAAGQEFFSDKPEKIVSFAAGAGYIIKGKPTADLHFS